MESKRKTVKVMHFLHWSRSGISELLRKNINYYGSSISNSLLLLDKDSDFNEYFMEFSPREQLNWKKNKFSFVFKFIKFVRFNNPDVLHCHSFLPLVLSFLLTRKNIIISVHSKYDYFNGAGLKNKLKKAIFVYITSRKRIYTIAVSESVQEIISSIKINSCELWRNAIPYSSIKKLNYEVDKKNIKLVCVSRIEKEKNLDQLIRAIADVNSEMKDYDVFLNIYGKGSLEYQIKCLVKELNLDGFVIFHGFSTSIENELIDADFFISASLNEAFGLATLEAARAKVPIITTLEGEVASSLVKENACIISKGYEHHSLKDAILLAISLNKYKKMEMADVAYEVFEYNYQTDIYINISTKGYERCGK